VASARSQRANSVSPTASRRRRARRVTRGVERPATPRRCAREPSGDPNSAPSAAPARPTTPQAPRRTTTRSHPALPTRPPQTGRPSALLGRRPPSSAVVPIVRPCRTRDAWR
jgi:hypothetical protein